MELSLCLIHTQPWAEQHMAQWRALGLRHSVCHPIWVAVNATWVAYASKGQITAL